jgi:hypothetical protein
MLLLLLLSTHNSFVAAASIAAELSSESVAVEMRVC